MASLRAQLSTTYLTEALNVVTGLAFGVIAARALEAAGRGQVAAIWTAIGISTMLAGFGLGKSLIVRLNNAPAGYEPRDYWGGVIVLFPASVAIAWAVLIPILPDLGAVEHGLVIAVLVAAPPALLATGIARGVHRARRRIAMVNASVAAGAVFRLACILVLWWLDRVTVAAVLMIELASVSLGGLVALITLSPRKIFLSRFVNARGAIAALLSFGLIAQLQAILVGMVTRSNVMALAWMSGDEATGLFAVAHRLADYLNTASAALLLVLMPFLAQRSDIGQRIEIAARTCRASLVILVPGGALLAIAAPWFVPLLYGESFVGAVEPLRIMILAAILVTLFQFSVLIDVARGDQRPACTAAGIGLATNLALMSWLIPDYGVIGAALCAVAGQLTSVTLYLGFLWMWLGIPPSRILVPGRAEVSALRRLFRRSE